MRKTFKISMNGLLSECNPPMTKAGFFSKPCVYHAAPAAAITSIGMDNMMRVREEKQQYNTTYLFDHVCHDPCIFHQWIWVQFNGPCKPQNPYKQGHHRHNSVEMIIFGAATITLLFSMRPGPLRECDLGFPVRRSWWYLFQSILCHVHHPPANKPGHTLHSCACLL